MGVRRVTTPGRATITTTSKPVITTPPPPPPSSGGGGKTTSKPRRIIVPEGKVYIGRVSGGTSTPTREVSPGVEEVVTPLSEKVIKVKAAGAKGVVKDRFMTVETALRRGVPASEVKKSLGFEERFGEIKDRPKAGVAPASDFPRFQETTPKTSNVWIKGKPTLTVEPTKPLRKTGIKKYTTLEGLESEKEFLKQQKQTIGTRAARFGLGVASIPAGIFAQPGEAVAIAGTFAVSPLLGFALLGATSGKETVKGLRTDPYYTGGQLAPLVAAPAAGKVPKRVATARKSSILRRPIGETEPFTQKPIEVFEYKLTESGKPILTDVKTRGLPVIEERTGAVLRERQTQIKPKDVDVLERFEQPRVERDVFIGKQQVKFNEAFQPITRRKVFTESGMEVTRPARLTKPGVQARLTDVFITKRQRPTPKMPKPRRISDIFGVGFEALELIKPETLFETEKPTLKLPKRRAKPLKVEEPLSRIAARKRFSGMEAMGYLPITKRGQKLRREFVSIPETIEDALQRQKPTFDYEPVIKTRTKQKPRQDILPKIDTVNILTTDTPKPPPPPPSTGSLIDFGLPPPPSFILGTTLLGGFPSLTLPGRRGKGGRKARKQKFRYASDVFSIATGKTIKKAPKASTRFTGLEARGVLENSPILKVLGGKKSGRGVF
jgi:hypothetical protein